MKDRGWLRLHKWRIAAAFLLAFSELSTAGAQESDIAEALRLTGQVVQYYATGRYQEAIPLAQRALAITEKARGPEHPDTAVALNNLASSTRPPAPTRRPSRSTSARWRSSRRRSAPSTPTPPARSTISPRCTDHGRLREGRAALPARLAIREKALGPEHPDTATSLNNLAVLYQTTGRLRRRPSRSTSARSRSARRRSAPSIPTPPSRSTTSPSSTRPPARYAKAEPLYRRALAI